MNIKRILGIVAVIAGVAMLFFSNYINTQIKEGKLKISKAQKQVDQGSKLFNASPYTRDIGKGITGGAQKKINEGQQMVTDYQVLADRLQVGGIIVTIVGVGLFAWSFTGKRKSRR